MVSDAVSAMALILSRRSIDPRSDLGSGSRRGTPPTARSARSRTSAPGTRGPATTRACRPGPSRRANVVASAMATCGSEQHRASTRRDAGRRRRPDEEVQLATPISSVRLRCTAFQYAHRNANTPMANSASGDDRRDPLPDRREERLPPAPAVTREQQPCRRGRRARATSPAPSATRRAADRGRRPVGVVGVVHAGAHHATHSQRRCPAARPARRRRTRRRARWPAPRAPIARAARRVVEQAPRTPRRPRRGRPGGARRGRSRRRRRPRRRRRSRRRPAARRTPRPRRTRCRSPPARARPTGCGTSMAKTSAQPYSAGRSSLATRPRNAHRRAALGGQPAQPALVAPAAGDRQHEVGPARRQQRGGLDRRCRSPCGARAG